VAGHVVGGHDGTYRDYNEKCIMSLPVLA